MKILKNIFLIIISLACTYFLSYPIGKFYIMFFPDGGGSFVDGTSLVGMPLAYIFFLTLLFTAFGDIKKYRWIGVLLIPAALFEIYFDLAHIYFPIALGLLGWIIGKGIEMIVAKRKGDVK